MTDTIRKRVGDALVTITIQEDNAIIDFRDIIKACKIVPDAHADAPWDNGDGWEHENRKAGEYDKDRRGRWYQNSRENGLIVVDKEWARENLDSGVEGMSKQARAERNAFALRAMIDQLVKWYENGWEYFGVVCEFKGHESSCWGYDDYAYAESQKWEHASEVAHELEEEGYTIINRPARNPAVDSHDKLHRSHWYMKSNYVR